MLAALATCAIAFGVASRALLREQVQVYTSKCVMPRAPAVSMLTLVDEVDEAALLATSTFPIKPDELIDRCKFIIQEQRKIQDGSITVYYCLEGLGKKQDRSNEQ
jgi:hypothetical protein